MKKFRLPKKFSLAEKPIEDSTCRAWAEVLLRDQEKLSRWDIGFLSGIMNQGEQYPYSEEAKRRCQRIYNQVKIQKRSRKKG